MAFVLQRPTRKTAPPRNRFVQPRRDVLGDQLKPERRFRQSVTKHLDGVYVWAINDSWHAGVPDHYYSGPTGDLWAEYKYFPTDREKFDLTRPPKHPKLSRLQQEWLNSRHSEGREVCVIVGMPMGGVILYDNRWMEPVIVEHILTRQEIAAEIQRRCNGF